MAIVKVTESNFEQEVLQAEGKVLVDFWAVWCGPCQMLLPVIEELSNEVTDAKICKINVDEESSLAEKYGVMSIPTLVVVKDGRTVSTSVGVQPKDKILEMLK